MKIPNDVETLAGLWTVDELVEAGKWPEGPDFSSDSLWRMFGRFYMGRGVLIEDAWMVMGAKERRVTLAGLRATKADIDAGFKEARHAG